MFHVERNVSYEELFSGWKNIVPGQSYHAFKSQKYIQLHCTRANFNRDCPKITFKIYLIWYKFWGRPLKLGNYVLGPKIELLREPIFDLGHRSKDMNFLNFLVGKNMPKMEILKFQKFIFSLLMPKSKIGSIKRFALVPRT